MPGWADLGEVGEAFVDCGDMMVATISESSPGGQCAAIRDHEWNTRATDLALALDSNR